MRNKWKSKYKFLTSMHTLHLDIDAQRIEWRDRELKQYRDALIAIMNAHHGRPECVECGIVVPCPTYTMAKKGLPS